MKTFAYLAAALTLGSGVTLVWAATPAQTITVRQANFKVIGKAFKALRDELGKGAPNVAVLRANSTVLANSAARVPVLFPAGSGPATGLNTKALPTVWSRNTDFRASANQLVGSVRAMWQDAHCGDSQRG